MLSAKFHSAFDNELHISPKPLLVALAVLGPMLYLAGEALSYPHESIKAFIPFTFLLWAMVAFGWMLGRLHAGASRLFTIATMVIAVYLSYSWLDIPGAQVFVVIPTALAAALAGPLVSAVTAMAQSVLLLMAARFMTTPPSNAAVIITLMVTWAVVSAIFVIFRPIYRLHDWLMQYYERTQAAVMEARERRADLEQTRDAWEHTSRQLLLANERLTALRLIAEQAQKNKAWFVARVSHEFRAPLNMIIGLVGLMIEKPEAYAEEFPPDLWTDLEIVYRNCQHLSSMINDVLDLSQAESGRLALQRHEAVLGEIIESALAVVRPLLEKKRLRLRVTIPEDLPKITCDRTRIRQVILNLVSNAARFTSKGGITLRVSQQDRHIIVSVADTGPGIAAEDIGKIFDPFYRGSHQLPDSGEGSGLGLSISKQFVSLHGGRMWAESEPGTGSTFFFTLPLSLPTEPIARPGHWIKQDWLWREQTFMSAGSVLADQVSRPRVVVCDGSGELHLELMRCSDEVEFVSATNLSEVVHEVKQCPVHAVVLNTPVVDGLLSSVDVARKALCGTPIIACTVPRRAAQALEAGALGHLVKPVTHTDLEKALRSVDGPISRVLVVDDDQDVLQLLTRMLHAYDDTLEVVTAWSGEQALNELRDNPPDLMLLDIVLPDMSGWQILRATRQDQRTRNMPVFFVSAQDPAQQPLSSKFLIATMDEGLSITKLLRGILQFSTLMLEPEQEPDRAPG